MKSNKVQTVANLTLTQMYTTIMLWEILENKTRNKKQNLDQTKMLRYYD